MNIQEEQELDPWLSENILLDEGLIGSLMMKILKGLLLGAAAAVIAGVFLYSVEKYGWIKAIGGLAIFKVVLDGLKSDDKKRIEKVRKLAKQDKVIEDVMKNGLTVTGFKKGYRVKFEQRLLEILPKEDYDEVMALGDRLSRHARQTIKQESLNKQTYSTFINQ
jgi:hypothetical protein